MDVLSEQRKGNCGTDEGEAGSGNQILGIRGGDVPGHGTYAPTRLLTPEELENVKCVQETVRQDDALRGLVGLGGGESNLLFQRRTTQRGVGGREVEWPELWEECHRMVLRYYAVTGDAIGYTRTARCMRECGGPVRRDQRRQRVGPFGEIPKIRTDGVHLFLKEENERVQRSRGNRTVGSDVNGED